jgi:transcriptional regulator with XRE-family HTH domain
MSQSDLGGLMNADGGQVSHWERGDTDLRLSTLRRLLDALGLDVVIVPKRPVR